MPDALRIDVSYSRTALYSCTSTSDISLLAKTVYKQSLEMDLRESHFPGCNTVHVAMPAADTHTEQYTDRRLLSNSAVVALYD
jgi:hypothetical protein